MLAPSAIFSGSEAQFRVMRKCARVAAELLKYLHIDAPSLYFDFRIDTLSDGLPIVIHQDSTAWKE